MSNHEAVGNFKESIRARRRLLQFLFDTALQNLKYVQDQTKGSEAVTIAQWMSQDCANALMLIVDYALVRFLVDAGLTQKQLVGKHKFVPEPTEVLEKLGVDAYKGVKFGRAIATLADQARHLHELPLYKRNLVVLQALVLDQEHDQAAAQFLQILGEQNPAFKSYDGFEDALLAIADNTRRETLP